MRNLFFSCLLLIFLFQISFFSPVSSQCRNNQRSLLLQLNNSLIYDSLLSTKLVQWNQHVDCCNWNGVECDSFGHVIGLELDHETITGGIENSSPLYSFRYLENLNLAYNNFNYTKIPRELGHLTNLARLNLSHAEFAGQIPVELSQMTSLVMLDLSCKFDEDLPLKLEDPNLKNFVQNLTSLKELYLDNVNITRQDDWWEALSLAVPSLQSLSLCYCDLSGPLDHSFLQLQSLSVLRLDGNNLSTTDLDIFVNFKNLTILSLSSCSLQGTCPQAIFQVPTLHYLDLSGNVLLNGTIPELRPGGSLRTLILRNSNFSGPLPDSIINLAMLSSMDLYNCSFTGTIPSTIGNMSELISLELSFNSFTGPIPVFSMSKKLTHIACGHNGLNGSLSSKHFEGLANLSFLYFDYNSLTGKIPTSLFRIPSLHALQLANNKFSGQINEFSTLNSSLDTLDLSSNQLEGPIPRSLFTLDSLTILSLSFNLFNGTIQLRDFQNLQNLRTLELGYNQFSVNISSNNSELSLLSELVYLNLASCNLSRFPNLRSQTNLRFLDLSNNEISGDIPSWIWEIGDGTLMHLNLSCNSLVSLQKPYQIPSFLDLLDLHSNMIRDELPVFQALPTYMDYSSNDFQGHIPVDIGSFTSFAYFFSVANNTLIGEIPTSLCSGTFLQVLDLSNNLLSGIIPPCLVQNLTTLGVLNIGGNNISGNIPDTFSVNCSLSTLDLSRNNLHGNIPATVSNCKLLQVMNVGSNNINDMFPCNLQNSSNLHVLILRSNKFFGDIGCPGFNNNWPSLQIIDIALNNFTGYLDTRLISSWTRMNLKNTPDSRKPLRFDSSVITNVYYQDKVNVVLKGLEVELIKILTVYTSIDFSCNRFHGVIPEMIGELSSLYVLNLSHNSFTGTIPWSIGNLTDLESMDFSTNQFTGQIPIELTFLTFLSFFNVSYNNLVGMIPSGNQFQTFSAASYEGNMGLCGFPVNQSCDSHEPTQTSTNTTISSEKDVEWIFILAGLGYAVGISLAVLPPLFSRRYGDRLDELQAKLLRLIFPRYRG